MFLADMIAGSPFNIIKRLFNTEIVMDLAKPVLANHIYVFK